MKSDVLIIGAELDGLLAALRLQDLGYSVRLLAFGVGSFHYAPGGVRVLSQVSGVDPNPAVDPFDLLPYLCGKHPYSLLGTSRIKSALRWFFDRFHSAMEIQQPSGRNHQIPSLVGQPLTFYAPLSGQVTFQILQGKTVILVSFEGHQDFAGRLIGQELSASGVGVIELDLPGPERQTGTVAIARAFDRVEDLQVFFQTLLELAVVKGAEIVLFPAVLGMKKHRQILRFFSKRGLTCGEIPTLPPSIPGLRINDNLQSELIGGGTLIHQGAKADGIETHGNRVQAVFDGQGQRLECSALLLCSGGVLMGGLEVDSHHRVSEPFLGLEAIAAEGLASGYIDGVLDGLHRSGVEVDAQLRPKQKGRGTIENLFVTGSTIAHWNPVQESSAEGVSIATAWAASEAVSRLLEAR
ncbi:MAG: anaerobic glycerol-3-phosphate dehydrogenase subunit B [Pseudomonadota bacterium]